MLICLACRFAIIDHTAHLKVCGELADMMMAKVIRTSPRLAW